jgi:hypothetical protein
MMTTIIEPSRIEYVKLIRTYLDNEIDEIAYGAKFQELLKRHKALEDERIALWPERYDRQIEKDYYSGKITLEEANKRSKKLWGENPKWYDVVYLDLVYLGDRRTGDLEVLESYRNDPDENKRTYFLTEEQFKEELHRYLIQLEECDD